MIRLLRFLRGVVTFSLTGGFPERFLNRSARLGIPVYGARREKERLVGNTTPTGYRRLRPVAKESETKMRVVKKSGFPFLFARWRRRRGLVVGAVLCVLFLLVMGQFLWRIEIEGAGAIPRSQVLEVLRECGVREGVKIRGIDPFLVENRLLLEFPELSWAGVNLHASTAEILLRERDAPPEIVNQGAPCNIVAGKTGQIVKLTVYQGESQVRVGDTVQEGELVVSGYVQGVLQKQLGYFVKARADVIAEFVEDVLIEVPLTQTIETPTGQEIQKSRLGLYALRLPLYFEKAPGKGWTESSQVQPLELFGRTLPLFLETTTYSQQEKITLNLTEQEARTIALQELSEREQTLQQSGEVVGRTAHGELLDNRFLIHAEVTIRRQIGREIPLQIENQNPPLPGAPKQYDEKQPTK